MGCIHSKQEERFINNLPQIQINLVKVYKSVHPHKTADEITAFRNSLKSNSSIFSAVQELEIKVFGKPDNGNNNLDYRVQHLLKQITVIV